MLAPPLRVRVLPRTTSSTLTFLNKLVPEGRPHLDADVGVDVRHAVVVMPQCYSLRRAILSVWGRPPLRCDKIGHRDQHDALRAAGASPVAPPRPYRATWAFLHATVFF
jgi:hypothetical protein